MPSNLGAAIYGLITVGALLAAETAQSETYAETVVAVVITLLIYWLAHSYADLTSWRLEASESLRLKSLMQTMMRQLPILFGAAIPLLALVIAWVAGAALTSAVKAALWTSAGMVVIVEFVAGVRAKESGRALVTQTAIGGLLGMLIIVLRLVLH